METLTRNSFTIKLRYFSLKWKKYSKMDQAEFPEDKLYPFLITLSKMSDRQSLPHTSG